MISIVETHQKSIEDIKNSILKLMKNLDYTLIFRIYEDYFFINKEMWTFPVFIILTIFNNMYKPSF